MGEGIAHKGARGLGVMEMFYILIMRLTSVRINQALKIIELLNVSLASLKLIYFLKQTKLKQSDRAKVIEVSPGATSGG